MALAVRSTSNASAQTGATFTVTKPTGCVDGDYLVAFQEAFLGGGSVPATPTGFSAGTATTFNLGGYWLNIFTKVASGEGADYTFNNASGGINPQSSVYMMCISGGGTLEGVSKASGTGTTPDPGAYSTTNDVDLVLTAWAIAINVAATITPHVSYTALGKIGGDVGAMNAGSKDQAAAGAVANRTATVSASVEWGAYLAAIKLSAVAPVTSFTRSPASGPVGTTVTGTDTSTNTPTSWDWDWGDGTAHSTTQNPTHVYTRPGTFTISMVATNAAGSGSAATATVTILPSGGTIGSAINSRRGTGGSILRRRIGRRL